MIDAVLFSEKTHRCKDIINGKITALTYLQRPIMEPPIKSYLYCGKPKRWTNGRPLDILYRKKDGSVECGTLEDIEAEYGGNPAIPQDAILSEKVIGEFVCDSIEYFDEKFYEWAQRNEYADSRLKMMSFDDFIKTAEERCGLTKDAIMKKYPERILAHIIGISELRIYDHPLEVSRFYARDKSGLMRPIYFHRGWSYVEEVR